MNRLAIKRYVPIASVAALSERLAGCRFGGTPPTALALVGERHAAPGDALAVRTNRRQNGNSLRFVIARRPQADVAISQYNGR